MRMRLPRSVVYLSFAMASLAAIGFIYQPIASAIEAHRYPAPGRLVDMGGYSLHIQCEGAGAPTVVLEAGLGGSSLDWSLVRPELAKETRVCVYDRAGYGWSEPGPGPRTGDRSAEELHTLLLRAGEPGPYILAADGHGGLYAQLFASAYPRETAGLVLVDPANGEAPTARPVPSTDGITARKDQVVAWLSRLSVHRVLAATGPDEVEARLPEEMRPEYRALHSTSRYFDAVARETASLPELQAQAGAAHLPTDLPLTVVAPDASGGTPHLDQPQAVLDAIRTVRDKARRGARRE